MDQGRNVTNTTVYDTTSNLIITGYSVPDTSDDVDVMMIIHIILSSVGITGNLNVLIVFLNHKKFKKKIPNIFIIHQVSTSKFSRKYYCFYFIFTEAHYYIIIAEFTKNDDFHGKHGIPKRVVHQRGKFIACLKYLTKINQNTTKPVKLTTLPINCQKVNIFFIHLIN